MMKFLVILILIFLAYIALKRKIRITTFKNYHRQNPGQDTKPEGTVTIENIDKKDKSKDSSNNDYVDFEEIK